MSVVGAARETQKAQVIALYSVQKKTVAPVEAISDNLFVCQALVCQGKTRGVWNPKQSQSGSDGASCRANFGTQRIGMDCMVGTSGKVRLEYPDSPPTRWKLGSCKNADQVSQKSRATVRYQFRELVRSRSPLPTGQQAGNTPGEGGKGYLGTCHRGHRRPSPCNRYCPSKTRGHG